MTVTTVNPKGQVTIPEPLRSKYGFPPGTRVIWVENGGDLIPRPQLPTQRMRGMCRATDGQASLTQVLLNERRQDRGREDR